MANERYLPRIENYLQDPDNFSLPSLSTHHSSLPPLADDEDINLLCSLKYQQKIKRDEEQGIISKVVLLNEDPFNNIEEPKKLLYLRDARNINEKDINEAYNFAGIGLNYLIAAKRMILTEWLENSVNINFPFLAEKLIAQIHNCGNINELAQVISDFLAIEIESKLKPFNHLFPQQNIRASLEKWARWASLEMPTPAISTIHSLSKDEQDEEIFIQLDTPQTQLTPEIEKEWQYAANLLPDYQKQNRFHWLDNGLDSVDKKNAAHYAPKILKQDRLLSAQVRDKAPGPKNIYKQQIFRYSKKADKRPTLLNNEHISSDKEIQQPILTLLNQIYHSATIVYLPNVTIVNKINKEDPFTLEEIEEEKLRLTDYGLRHLQRSADQLPVHYFTLNSKEIDKILGFFDKQYYGVDTDIVTFTQKSARKFQPTPGIFVSNFCLNKFRLFFGDDRPGIAALESHIRAFNKFLEDNEIQIESEELQALIMDFQTVYKDYFDYSGKGTNADKMKAELSRVYRKLADPADRRVNNLVEITIISILLNLKNRFLDELETLPELKEQLNYTKGKTALFVGCASGDNRTGILLIDIAAQSMWIVGHEHLMQRFARAGHNAELSGASECTGGIRKKSEDSFPGNYSKKVKSILLGKAADIKSLPAPCPFIALNETLNTIKTEAPSRYIHAAQDYYNELKEHDVSFTQTLDTIDALIHEKEKAQLDELNNPDPNKNELTKTNTNELDISTHTTDNKKIADHEKFNKLDIPSLYKKRIKIENERRDLRTVAGNLNKVLNTLHGEEPLETKRATLNQFKKTIPEASLTENFCKFISIAFSILILPLHILLVHTIHKTEAKEIKRNNRIAGDFNKMTQILDEEYQDQVETRSWAKM